eukprot:11667830-Ditylum_brightwellii.AAC.1
MFISTTRHLLSFSCKTHTTCPSSLAAVTAAATTTTSCYEIDDYSVKMPEPVSSTATNVNDGTEVIFHSLLSDDGYSAPTAHGISNCLIVSSPSNAGCFKSCLQGIDQPLDRQAWSEVVQSMKTYHVHLVEASMETESSSHFPSNDELRKLIRIAAEGNHILKDTFCSIGEGPKSNAEKRIHYIVDAADALKLASLFCQQYLANMMSTPILL